MGANFSKRVRYARRYNRDGSTDSICRECFMTIATATWEADLERAEEKHDCEPRALGDRKRIPQPEARATVLPWRAAL